MLIAFLNNNHPVPINIKNDDVVAESENDEKNSKIICYIYIIVINLNLHVFRNDFTLCKCSYLF